MGSKRKEPEPNAGGAPGSTEATPVKQTKKQKTAAAAAAAAAAGPGAGGEGGGDAAQAAKPKKSRPKKPKADAAAQPATGAAAAGAAGAAGPAGAAEAQEEQEAPEDLMSHDMMRNALRKKKLEDAEKMKGLWEQFTDAQKARYEKYYTSWLDKKAVEEVIKEAANTGSGLHEDIRLVISGLGKLFVGQLVEEGRRVMAEMGDKPEQGLRPHHLREALARLNRGPVRPGRPEGVRPLGIRSGALSRGRLA